MAKTRDFTGDTRTVTGIPLKNVKWNSVANLYLGMAQDPQWTGPSRSWVTASWTKNGKCVNRNRPDMDLKEP